MRKSGWTPSIVPTDEGQTVYLVMDDLGRLGRVWRETAADHTDLETAAAAFMSFNELPPRPDAF